MLLGRYYTRISSKGRLALPFRFKNQVGVKFVVARWYENCLLIVSLASWEDFLKRFTKPNEVITEDIRDLDRFILGSSFLVDTDSQGRFVVPKFLRDYARLIDEVVFIGLGDRVELWSKENWDKYESDIDKRARKAIENLTKK